MSALPDYSFARDHGFVTDTATAVHDVSPLLRILVLLCAAQVPVLIQGLLFTKILPLL